MYIRSCRTAFGRDGHPALSCQPDLTLEANRFGPGKAWEEWIIESISSSEESAVLVAVRSRWKGTYLSAKDDGRVLADAESIGENESWILEKQQHPDYNDNELCFSLKSARFHRYLVCDDLWDCGKTVRADRHEAHEWEKWMIIPEDAHALTYPGFIYIKPISSLLKACLLNLPYLLLVHF